MQRIDSHQHFWHYDPSRQSWMTNEMQVLKRNYLPEDLLPLLQQCGLGGCIAVQASQTREENDFLLGLAAAHPFIKGVVGWIDWQSQDIKEQLAYYQKVEKMKGFRHVIHDEPDKDFMLQPGFINYVTEVLQHGFVYDILIFDYHLPNTLQFLQQLPAKAMVIDHIAKPKISKTEIRQWKKDLKEIAAHTHIYCKISGMVTEAVWKQWKYEDFVPYMDTVMELFGPDRVLYGSDWPVCTLSASYADTYGIVGRYFEQMSAAEKEKFFGGNATAVYGL
jgi:L-fuconolactonase